MTTKKIVEKNGIEYKENMKKQWIKGDLMITMPAPEGEPRRYNKESNTGGRRFVCWA